MKSFEWTVIGAGPAGIAAVGRLIDSGINPQEIAWIDPQFKVGDLGEKWYRVSSNTKVKLFLKFLETCSAFRFQQSGDFEIKHLDPESTCLLEKIVEPLQWVTNHIKLAVHAIESRLTSLEFKNQRWELKYSGGTLLSRKVILAIGSEPKRLNFPALEEIPLEIALYDEKLLQEKLSGETVAVFGASHSAIVVLQNLLKTEAKKIINFYASPLKYAVYMDSWILFDNTGLKGEAAAWARAHIDGTWPDRLERFHSNHPQFNQIIASCTKVIYAIGFEARIPPKTPQFEELIYNEHNGIIAPGLFGLGIAYPQKSKDPFGHEEYNVGLWKFMAYLEKVLPLWLKYVP